MREAEERAISFFFPERRRTDGHVIEPELLCVKSGTLFGHGPVASRSWGWMWCRQRSKTAIQIRPRGFIQRSFDCCGLWFEIELGTPICRVDLVDGFAFSYRGIQLCLIMKHPARNASKICFNNKIIFI